MFYVFSKLIYPLIRPSTLVVLLGAAGLVAARFGRRRLSRALMLTVVVGVCLATFLPTGNLMLSFLETRVPMGEIGPDAAGIIYLGGVVENERRSLSLTPPMSAAGERVLEVALLARSHPNLPVIISDGIGEADVRGDSVSEADLVRGMLIDLGVEPQRILVENRSRNTAENALFVAELLSGALQEPFVLVTSAWHMPRAVLCFEMAGFAKIIARPVDSRVTYPLLMPTLEPLAGFEKIDMAMREAIGLVAYRLTGRIARLLP